MGEEDIRPTPAQVEAALKEMLLIGGRHEDVELDNLWWVEAIDPDGEIQGCGTHEKIPEAVVAAWLTANGNDECLACWSTGRPITQAFYDSVPRHVPAGWTFRVNRSDEIAFELADGVTPDEVGEAVKQMLRPEPKN